MPEGVASAGRRRRVRRGERGVRERLLPGGRPRDSGSSRPLHSALLGVALHAQRTPR